MMHSYIVTNTNLQPVGFQLVPVESNCFAIDYNQLHFNWFPLNLTAIDMHIFDEDINHEIINIADLFICHFLLYTIKVITVGF